MWLPRTWRLAGPSLSWSRPAKMNEMANTTTARLIDTSSVPACAPAAMILPSSNRAGPVLRRECLDAYSTITAEQSRRFLDLTTAALRGRRGLFALNLFPNELYDHGISEGGDVTCVLMVGDRG